MIRDLNTQSLLEKHTIHFLIKPHLAVTHQELALMDIHFVLISLFEFFIRP